MGRKVMLTTTDNPYDPRTQFEDWYAFDVAKGYNSCAYLARVAKTSEGLSDYDNEVEIENAINEIVKYNLDGVYKKVVYST